MSEPEPTIPPEDPSRPSPTLPLPPPARARRRARLVAFFLVPMLFSGIASCALATKLFSTAAPIAADALAEYQARARELAPTLPADDPRLDDIARRLLALEASKAREQAADDCETAAGKASDAAALVAALEDAARAKAEATRARDALAAALRALPVASSTAISSPPTDAGAEGGAL